jgi:glutaredoxin 3
VTIQTAAGGGRASGPDTVTVARKPAAAAPTKLPCADLTELSCLAKVVAWAPVVVFTQEGCPYCKAALRALAADGAAAPVLVDLTGPGGYPIKRALARMTGRATVPNVFIGGNSVGGGDETTALHRVGKLRAVLEAAQSRL